MFVCLTHLPRAVPARHPRHSAHLPLVSAQVTFITGDIHHATNVEGAVAIAEPLQLGM